MTEIGNYRSQGNVIHAANPVRFTVLLVFGGHGSYFETHRYSDLTCVVPV